MKKNILKIKYFGVPIILYNDQVIKLPIKKLEAFIYYLAYYKRAERVELVNLLWSNKDESLGRKNLRNAIYKLKKSLNLDKVFSTCGQILEFDESIEIQTDLPDSNNFKEMRILNLEFLKGFFIKNSYEFDEWISKKRNFYDEKYMIFLKKGLENAYKNKLNEDIENFLKLIIEKDIYNEKYYRQLMIFLFEMGEYNNAISLYNSLKKLLDNELGISPDLETENLILKIMEVKEINNKENLTSDKKDFYGRDKYIEVLLKNYFNFKKGFKYSSIFIRGEAGIGKTKLKDEFVKNFDNDIYFFETQAYQMEKKYYLKPWYIIFENLKRIIGEDEIEIPSSWEKIISIAFPNFSDGYEDFLNENIEQSETLRYPAVENTIVKLFNKISSKKRIIISFDDLQWIDKLSFDLLKAIANNDYKNRIMIIGTVRMGRDKEIDKFFVSLSSSQKIKYINLERFSKKEVNEYLDYIFGEKGIDYNLRERIYRETEGNTYFLIEYVNNIIDGKSIPNITQDMKDVLRSRIIDISDEGKKLLNIMAMFFDEIPFEILKVVSSKKEFELIEIIEDLKKRNIIVEIEYERGISYKFTHQKIREFIYIEQSLTSKRIFHTRIANIIEKNLKGNNFDRIFYSKLIYHYSKGGNISKAIEYKLKNAHEYFDFSHELIPENHNLGNLDKKSLIISNEMTLEMINDIEEDIVKLKKSNSLDKKSKNDLIEFFHIKGRFFIREGLYERGIESINKAKEMSEETKNYEYMINCYLQLIYLSIQINDLIDMKIYIESANEVALKEKIFSKLGTINRLKGLYYLLTKDYKSAIIFLNKSIELFENYEKDCYLKDLNIAAVYNYIGEINRNTLNFSGAFEFYDKAIKISRNYNNLNGMSTFYTNAARNLYEMENYKLANEYIEKALEYFKITNLIWRRSMAESLKALIELKNKNYNELFEHFNRAILYSEKMNNSYVLGILYRLKASIKKQMSDDKILNKIFKDILTESLEHYCDRGIIYYENSEDGYEKEILKMMKSVDF